MLLYLVGGDNTIKKVLGLNLKLEEEREEAERQQKKEAVLEPMASAAAVTVLANILGTSRASEEKSQLEDALT